MPPLPPSPDAYHPRCEKREQQGPPVSKVPFLANQSNTYNRHITDKELHRENDLSLGAWNLALVPTSRGMDFTKGRRQDHKVNEQTQRRRRFSHHCADRWTASHSLVNVGPGYMRIEGEARDAGNGKHSSFITTVIELVPTR